MPYSVLCQAFTDIEAVTSRLLIQQIFTTLLRQIAVQNPVDLYPVLYLASNDVAPAYECVELGVGDSILVRAIGEATGTNPAMVKKRYEEIGDLGDVAKSFKSKQRTLGGFFQKSVAPKKPLTAAQVLHVFREIAQTKGNQSQKWKVENIKKLIVQATEATETKYIVRGLQGKLRIGLAQSTVLIGLAHALALTPPTTLCPHQPTLAELGTCHCKHS
jgi:DNA ligase-1